MTKEIIIKKSHIMPIAAASFLAACMAVTATPYHWRNYVSDLASERQLNIQSVVDSSGNTYQVFAYPNELDARYSLRKISSEGSELWRSELANTGIVMLVLAGDEPVVTDRDKITSRFSSDGMLKWSRQIVPVDAVIRNITGTANDKLFITYGFPFGSELVTIASDEAGIGIWSYSFADVHAISEYVFPVAELSSGNVVLINKRGAELVSSVIDTSGNLLFQQVIQSNVQERSDYYIPQGDTVYSRYGHVVIVVPTNIPNTTLMALNADGSVKWTQSYDGKLQCSTPSPEKIACLHSRDDQPKRTVWIALDEGVVTKDIVTDYKFSYMAYRYNEPTILYNDENEWILAEVVAPDRANSALDALFAKPFYVRFHVYSDQGIKINSITMEPGKVDFSRDDFGEWLTPNVRKDGDAVSVVTAKGDNLIVTGYSDAYFWSRSFVSSYFIK